MPGGEPPMDLIGRAPTNGSPRARDDAGHSTAGTSAAAPTEREREGVNPRYTFEAFVIGTSNRFAHAAALSVAETPARSYNPLFIYGDAGLGKTHLLQAIAHYVNENYPSFVVRYVTTETFLNQFVDAIRANAMADFKKRYREVDVLLLDDIQFIEKSEQLQEEFFHTFNALYQANRQIVLSSDRPPDAIATLEDRLRSRFKMGLTTEINPPELETRLAILRKKAESETDAASTERCSSSSPRTSRTTSASSRVRSSGCARYASLTSEQLTRRPRPTRAGRHHRRQPAAPDHARSDPAEDRRRCSASRSTRSVARAAGVRSSWPARSACTSFRELTDLSYPAIAREFGGRDHTTVIHAVEKIGGLMKERRQIYDQVTELIQAIRSGS